MGQRKRKRRPAWTFSPGRAELRAALQLRHYRWDEEADAALREVINLAVKE